MIASSSVLPSSINTSIRSFSDLSASCSMYFLYIALITGLILGITDIFHIFSAVIFSFDFKVDILVLLICMPTIGVLSNSVKGHNK